MALNESSEELTRVEAEINDWKSNQDEYFDDLKDKQFKTVLPKTLKQG